MIFYFGWLALIYRFFLSDDSLLAINASERFRDWLASHLDK